MVPSKHQAIQGKAKVLYVFGLHTQGHIVIPFARILELHPLGIYPFVVFPDKTL